MLENGRISWRQVAFLIATSRLALIITYPVLFSLPPANHDVWLNALGAMLLFPLLLLPLLALARRFPQQTLVQYCQALLGPMGKIIGLLYIWFFVHLGAIYLRQFTELFTSVTMPETPPVVFSVAMAVLAAAAVRSGLEVIGRMVELIGPFVFFPSAWWSSCWLKMSA